MLQATREDGKANYITAKRRFHQKQKLYKHSRTAKLLMKIRIRSLFTYI